LPNPIRVYNVDGTPNQGGSITEEITFMMTYKGHKEKAVFEVCDLGKESIIVGLPWLRKHNPEVNWDTGEVKMTRCPQECNVWIRHAKKERKRKRIADRWRYTPSVEEVKDEDAHAHHIGGLMGEHEDSVLEEIAREFIQKTEVIREADKPAKTLEEQIPRRYWRWLKVFEKKASERMPKRKPWDHAIDMKPGFESKKAKNIPLSPQEQKEVEEFLNNQLGKGYIRESKSPQTSAVFFVPKKDMKKRMVQDY